MNQADVIETLAQAMQPDDSLRAVFLIGSFGRGDADEYSDVDLVAVVDAALLEPKFTEYQDRITRILPVLYRKTLPGSRTINSITQEWLRVDLTFVAPERLGAYSKDQVRVLFDRCGLLDALPDRAQPAPLRAEEVTSLADEFIRVFGLLPVAIGREDYVLAQTGAVLLRDMLIRAMLLANRARHHRGVLALKRAVSDDQYRALAELPPLAANKDAVIAAHRAIGAHFLPLAASLSVRTGVPWPTEFAARTVAHVERAVGITVEDAPTDDAAAK